MSICFVCHESFSFFLLLFKKISRAELFDFHGNVQNFQARPDDILIATYPKAGNINSHEQNNKKQYIKSWNIKKHSKQIFKKQQQINPLLLPCETLLTLYLPFHTGKDLADNLPTSPRLIKTHLPVQFVPKSFWEQNSTIIYVARNAKDNMVSYFHFDRMTRTQPEPGEWSSYIHRFMEGKMVFGSWYDHVNGWWKKKQTHSKLHYMFYEDLSEDTGREIDNLCSFLGLSRSDEEKKRVASGVQFDNMKKDDTTNYSTHCAMDFKISPFMRKGKVGDWKNHFTVAQSQQCDEDYEKKMKNSTLQFRTEI
uniref:Sulfotransferase n=1 Tax=Sander lucioperca TaxID=283035 RepID=A0A8C9XPL3_SANLU